MQAAGLAVQPSSYPQLELLWGRAGSAEEGFLPRQAQSCQHRYLMTELVSNGKAVLQGQESAASCLWADKGVLFTPENWSSSPWQEEPGRGTRSRLIHTERGKDGACLRRGGRLLGPDEGQGFSQGESGGSQKEGPLS